MDKKALYNLLHKYLNNTCNLEEKIMVDKWLELLQDDSGFVTYSKNNLETIQTRIWEKIQTETQPQKIESKKPLIFGRSFLVSFSKWSIAASLVFALVYAGSLFRQAYLKPRSGNFASIIPATGFVTKKNRTGAPVKIQLEDRTIVILEPGTTLNYPAHFNVKERIVYLEGEAFFDVSKNAKSPFFIYHNNLVTHVLGTTFVINTKRNNNNAEVSVMSGRVEVSENTDLVKVANKEKGNGVVLTPNQKVVYSEDARTFVASIVDKPIAVNNSASLNLEFVDEEMGEVLATISKEYAIEILVENENINKCTFTGNLSKHDLYSILNAICESINSSYELKGTKILLKGSGCE